MVTAFTGMFDAGTLACCLFDFAIFRLVLVDSTDLFLEKMNISKIKQ